MLHTIRRMANDRKHCQQQESNCLSQIRRRNNSPHVTVWSVYRLPLGPSTIMGYTLRPRSATSSTKFFYYADVCARTPPLGWISHKISFHGFYETPSKPLHGPLHPNPQPQTISLFSSDNQIFHVCRIWGELQPSPLSCLLIQSRFS